MSDDDIFVARLQLLIIMSKAFLKGFTMGEYQKKAIVENAQTLFYSSLFMEHRENGAKADLPKTDNLEAVGGGLFLNKVRLLSVAALAFAQERFPGEHKKKELRETIDFISKNITFESQISNIAFLKSG
jgi:hypothetical protein